ncbi:hypothetical protein TNCV_2275011 [Trichonephila clavipes]|nr:hypothetical protein TNCV_2275011 [Trichonephila clavipes]
MEIHTCCFDSRMVSAGCGCCWRCRPMISHTCSMGDRSDDLEPKAVLYVAEWRTDFQSVCYSAAKVIGNCSPDRDSRGRSSASRPQTVWLQAFPWPPFDQPMAPSLEPAFIRKHNRYQILPPMSPGVAAGNCLESVEYTAQGTWLGVVLEVTNS